MRLTLRALLAYLDDVLEPAQAKEIGTRVSESPPAASTVARIKEVVRRRRIAAPELTGSGSAPDPNLVGEYLDNTLAPDAVPALEKLCLESDMHLAEVAASHQILTAVLGEPVEVPVSTRERMYALVSQAPPVVEPASAPSHEPTPVSGSAGPAPRFAHTTQLPSRPPLSPDYLKPSVGRKVLLGIVAIALVGGWLTWVLRDQGLLPKKPAESVEVATNTEQVELAATEEPVANEQPAAVAVNDPGTPESSTPADNALAKVDGPMLPPLMPQDLKTGEPMPGAPAPEVAAPVVAAPGEAGLAAQPEPLAPEVPQTSEFPAALYVNADGILIARNPQSGEWNVLPRRSLLHAGDQIATPEPFRTEIVLGNSTVEMTLFAGTRLTLQKGTPNQLLSLVVDRGRIGLRRPLAGEDKAPVPIGLNLRGQAAELVLLEPGTQCGLEVGQRAPQGRRADALLNSPEGGINVATGSVSVAWAGGQPLTIGADVGWAAWPVPQSAMKAGPLRAIPSWLAPEGVPLTAADKKLHQLFEKEFSVDQPVSVSIPALVQDRREGISELATLTLGVVDDVPTLVKALQSEHDKTRLGAIRNLRGWLPTDPNNHAVLEMEVARFFPDEDVSDVVELLWGFSMADARDETTSRRLLALMDHSELAIRELAHFDVALLTGRPYAHGYRPTLPDAARNAALMGWQNQIERNGGKLLK
jgi:hypothetical protein